MDKAFRQFAERIAPWKRDFCMSAWSDVFSSMRTVLEGWWDLWSSTDHGVEDLPSQGNMTQLKDSLGDVVQVAVKRALKLDESKKEEQWRLCDVIGTASCVVDDMLYPLGMPTNRNTEQSRGQLKGTVRVECGSPEQSIASLIMVDVYKTPDEFELPVDYEVLAADVPHQILVVEAVNRTKLEEVVAAQRAHEQKLYMTLEKRFSAGPSEFYIPRRPHSEGNELGLVLTIYVCNVVKISL
jgi:hypothetical protein